MFSVIKFISMRRGRQINLTLQFTVSSRRTLLSLVTEPIVLSCAFRQLALKVR